MYYNGLAEVSTIALAVGSASITIARTKIFKSLRRKIAYHSDWLGSLVRCPYCVGHWLSFLAIGIFRPHLISTDFIDYVLAAFVTVALSAMVSGLIRYAFEGMNQADQDDIQALEQERALKSEDNNGPE